MDRQDVPMTPSDDELLAWDWVAEVQRQERGPKWLGSRTGRATRTVRAYRRGDRKTPITWLRDAWRVLMDPRQ